MPLKKETDLVSYLPPFMAEYKEINEVLTAENPEFQAVWNAAEGVLYNEFISTADNYGISRFEKMMGLKPSEEDTLESRRARVMSKWLSKLPYTMKMLINKLFILCGGDDFKVSKSFDSYIIRVTTHLRLYSQIQELKELLEQMIPANMTVESFNSIAVPADGSAKIYTGVGAESIHKKRKVEVKNYGLE